MTKKIGIVCTSPGFGGLEMYTLQLAQSLSKKGWEVFFLLNEKSKLYEYAKPHFSTSSVQDFHKEKNSASLIHQWNKQHQLRLIFTPYNKDIQPLSAYKRLYNRKLKLVYQQHMKVGVKKRDLIHRLRYNMLDLWITPLEYLKQETLEKTTVKEENIRIVPVGLAFEKFPHTVLSKEGARRKLNLPQEVFLIGILGRIDPKKGQDFLIKALASLKEEIPVHLLIMGAATAHEGDAWMQHLHTLVAQYSTTERVHFQPYQQDVSLFYSAIDVFAMASHGETYGLVTLEALYFEKPVTGVDTDGTKALLENGRLGWLHKLEDIETFGKHLHTIIHYPQQATEKTALAKKTVTEHYDFELTVTEMENLFIQLLS